MARNRHPRQAKPRPAPPPPRGDGLLFQSPSPLKIQILTWAFGAVQAFCLVAAYWCFTTMVTEVGDAALAPLWQRLLTAGFIVLAGLLFFGGMLVYLPFYTTRLWVVPGTDQVQVETLRLWGRRLRTLAMGDVASTAYHEGKVNYQAGHSVDAPWFWVKVKGGRGFLLDLQGEFFDTEALAQVLSANWTTPIGGDVDRLDLGAEDPPDAQ